VFLSLGAGPLDARLSRLFVRRALGLPRYVSLRDPRSAEIVAALGHARPRPVFPDLAYGLPIRRARASSPRHGRVRVVGVHPIAAFDPRVWPVKDRSKYLAYLGKLAEFTCWLLDGGVEVRLFSSQAKMDRTAIADLENLLGAHAARGRGRLARARIENVADL